MDTAVDRFLGKYPTARLGLAAIVSIVVLADLIVLVGDTAAVSEWPAPVASTPADSVAPSFDQSAQPTAEGSAAAAPPASVSPVPTESVRPTPPTRTAHAPAPAPPTSTTPRRPRPSSTHRTRSPFEERCRDGEIEPWLCHGMPN
jgi:hypothetical protein